MLSIVLTLVLTGFQFTITAPAGCHPCYVQVDTTPGLSGEPQIFQFDLAPGESFGATVNASPTPGLHLAPESVRVRVWTPTSGTVPDADASMEFPTPAPYRIYLPL